MADKSPRRPALNVQSWLAAPRRAAPTRRYIESQSRSRATNRNRIRICNYILTACFPLPTDLLTLVFQYLVGQRSRLAASVLALIARSEDCAGF